MLNYEYNFGDFLAHFWVEYIGSLILGFGLNILRLQLFGFWLLPWFWFGAYATAWRVTGAHLNPAVSLVWILRTDKSEHFRKLWALAYIFAQYAGFFTAVVLGYWFKEDPGQLEIGRKNPMKDSWWYSEAVGIETAASLAFVLIYLNQTSRFSWLHPDPGLQCLLVGLSYGALVGWSAYRAGGSLNPAYGFAQNFWDEMDEGSSDDFKFIWIYTACPIVGALFAWGIHELVVLKGHAEHAKHHGVHGQPE